MIKMGNSERTLTGTDLRNYLLVILIVILGILGYIILTGYIFQDFMNSLTKSEIYPGIATSTTVLFSSVLFIRAKQNNVRGIRYLLIFGFSLFMFNLLQIFSWDVARVDTPFKRPIGNEILNLADMFLAFAVVSLYLHFESIESVKFHPVYASLVGLSVFPIVVVNLLVILTQNEDLNSTIEYFLPWFSISVIFIVINGIRVTLRIYLFTDNKAIRRGTLSMMTSIIYMAIAFSTQTLTSDNINFGLFEAEIHQLLLFAIATSMLSYAYIVNPYFLYAVPFTVSEIMVYDINGIPLWDYQFSKVHSQKPLPIKSSALNAIGALLREVSGFSGVMTNIGFTDGNLLIKHMDTYALCLVTEKNSRIITWAFQGFSREINPLIEKYLVKLMRQEFLNEDVIYARNLITKYFPFASVDDVLR
ncbi:MAG: hypothetical protein HeimC2_30850 [Candidatus Heimdallarchaeota archaeon LC_2]|nr:MAG: hypothetical protein HeimC2_30850 [Candidatus Heimdallarchaeota archaeon LC_2]